MLQTLLPIMYELGVAARLRGNDHRGWIGYLAERCISNYIQQQTLVDTAVDPSPLPTVFRSMITHIHQQWRGAYTKDLLPWDIEVW